MSPTAITDQRMPSAKGIAFSMPTEDVSAKFTSTASDFTGPTVNVAASMLFSAPNMASPKMMHAALPSAPAPPPVFQLPCGGLSGNAVKNIRTKIFLSMKMLSLRPIDFTSFFIFAHFHEWAIFAGDISGYLAVKIEKIYWVPSTVRTPTPYSLSLLLAWFAGSFEHCCEFSTCWEIFSVALKWLLHVYFPFISWWTGIQRCCRALSTFEQFRAMKWHDHFSGNRSHWFWFRRAGESEVSQHKACDTRCSQRNFPEVVLALKLNLGD